MEIWWSYGFCIQVFVQACGVKDFKRDGRLRRIVKDILIKHTISRKEYIQNIFVAVSTNMIHKKGFNINGCTKFENNWGILFQLATLSYIVNNAFCKLYLSELGN